MSNSAHSEPPVVNLLPPAETCTDWYWVTTYYYDDGTYEEVWQYLYTTCDDGGGGGGGGGSTPPSDVPYEIDYSENGSEADAEGAETPDGTFGAAPPINYTYTYTIQYVRDEVINVIRYPVTASPMIASYMNGGWNTTRRLTLLGQSNSWTPLTFDHGYISWNWYTHAYYTYLGSTETRTRQWPNYHGIAY